MHFEKYLGWRFSVRFMIRRLMLKFWVQRCHICLCGDHSLMVLMKARAPVWAIEVVDPSMALCPCLSTQLTTLWMKPLETLGQVSSHWEIFMKDFEKDHFLPNVEWKEILIAGGRDYYLSIIYLSICLSVYLSIYLSTYLNNSYVSHEMKFCFLGAVVTSLVKIVALILII